jgi:predicted molibdopterin-dependent oxidoreductase YjgC
MEYLAQVLEQGVPVVAAMSGDDDQNGSRSAPSGTGVSERRAWRISLDGKDMSVREGQTIAAVLLASGCKVFRYTIRNHEPRGLFCGMGICFECLVQIDGRPNVRACQTLVRDGMRVATQHGEGVWESQP